VSGWPPLEDGGATRSTPSGDGYGQAATLMGEPARGGQQTRHTINRPYRSVRRRSRRQITTSKAEPRSARCRRAHAALAPAFFGVLRGCPSHRECPPEWVAQRSASPPGARNDSLALRGCRPDWFRQGCFCRSATFVKRSESECTNEASGVTFRVTQEFHAFALLENFGAEPRELFVTLTLTSSAVAHRKACFPRVRRGLRTRAESTLCRLGGSGVPARECKTCPGRS
jgi:hypothetical protein